MTPMKSAEGEHAMRLTIRNKLLVILTAVAVVSAGVTAYLGFSNVRHTLEESTFSQLTVVREMKADQVEDYFQQIVDQTVTFSGDRMIVDAALEFRRAFASLGRELNPGRAQTDEADLRLRMYYQQEFLPRLGENLGEADSVSRFWPPSRQARLFQDIFIASNPFDTGSKDEFDDPRNGTSYARAHRLYHPIIREFLERFGYYDIFIVDHETGHIVYSVFKEVDFGTSLLSGPYRETNFAEAFEAARGSDAPDFVRLVDFAAYKPSYNAFASFIASPIFDGDDMAGVLVFQMPVDRINNIMTNDRRWREVGLGETGESYIVGEDFTLRNQSRFLIEDREGFLATIRAAGTEPSTIEAIAGLDSTIGLQRVETEGVEEALMGRTGTRIFTDYRGVDVLSSFRPLDIRDVRWVLLSEIDEAEAFAPVRALRNRALLFMTVLVVVIGCVAWVFSRSLTHRLKHLTRQAAELAEGDLGVEMATTGHDEIADLARSLEVMRRSLQELVESQERSIDALSVPMIPLRDGVVAMPLVGELDSRRLAKVRNELVEGLSHSGATVALLDLTGVPSLDADSAVGIEGAVKAARLIGAQVVITGLRAEIARNLADLGVHFEGIAIEGSIQSGITLAMRLIESPGVAWDDEMTEENEG
jgi:anti-anti-sigma regulatory factor/HAMP domain-containing protein